MKNELLYNRTVSILVDAYFKDTLRHGDPCGCAVGNIVAANNDIKVIEKGQDWEGTACPEWDSVVNLGNFHPDYYFGKAKEQIDSTGYSAFEIHLIEKAFEGVREYEDRDLDMFNGLMSVIDVLDEIHENKDQSITHTSKSKFNKQLI